MRKTIGFIFQLFFAVVLVLSLIPASGEAVPVTVDFQGSLSSGQTFSGSFTYDTGTLPAFVLPNNTLGAYPNAGTLSVSVGSSTWTGANAFVFLNDLAGAGDDTFSILSSNISGPSSPSSLSLFFSGPSTLSNVLSLPSVFPTNFSLAELSFSNGTVVGYISSVSVPEPSSFMLMGMGLIAAALTVRKIKRR